MTRNNARQSRAEMRAVEAKREQEELLKGVASPTKLTDAQRQRVLELEDEIKDSRGATQASMKEYLELQKRHQEILAALKATRQQRIERVESSKESFVGIIRRLMDEREKERENRRLEIMKRATEREAKRLSQSVEFEEGRFDQPLFNSETVG